MEVHASATPNLTERAIEINQKRPADKTERPAAEPIAPRESALAAQHVPTLRHVIRTVTPTSSMLDTLYKWFRETQCIDHLSKGAAQNAGTQTAERPSTTHRRSSKKGSLAAFFATR